MAEEGDEHSVKTPTLGEFLTKEFGAELAQAMADVGVMTFEDLKELAADAESVDEVFATAGAAGTKFRRRKLCLPAFLGRVADLQKDEEQSREAAVRRREQLREVAARQQERRDKLAARLDDIAAAEAELTRLAGLRDKGLLTAHEFEAQRAAELGKIGIDVGGGSPAGGSPAAGRGSPPAVGLTVHPPTADMFVQLTDPATGKAVGRPQPSNASPLRFEGVPPGTYVAVFFVPRKVPRAGEAPPAMDAPGSVIVSKNQLKLNSDFSTEPEFIDSGATEATMKTVLKDKPVTDKPTTFINKHQPANVLERNPDATGTASATLPDGDHTVRTLAGDESIHIKKRQLETAPPPPNSGVGQQKMTKTVDCGSFIEGIATTSRHFAALGDVSGSMGDPLMSILRKSFHDLAKKYPPEKCDLRLFAWNSHLLSGPPLKQQESARLWIENLRAGGGNNLRYALEETLSLFPEVQEVFVMCDGDMKPFGDRNATNTNFSRRTPKPSSAGEEASGSDNWDAFVAYHRNVRFHFIALGTRADGERMKEMAVSGRGNFTRQT